MNEEIKTEGNTEIVQALKEFEKQSEPAPSYEAVKFYKESTTPKIVELVMKWSGGAIKEQKQAEYVLLGFVVMAMGISIYLVFGGSTTTSIPIDIQNIDQSQFIQFNE
ncbi:MAG: hypothetical protein WA060_00585 [Minisyncoccia bacterium]